MSAPQQAKCPSCRRHVATTPAPRPANTYVRPTSLVLIGHGSPYGGHCPGSGTPVPSK